MSQGIIGTFVIYEITIYYIFFIFYMQGAEWSILYSFVGGIIATGIFVILKFYWDRIIKPQNTKDIVKDYLVLLRQEQQLCKPISSLCAVSEELRGFLRIQSFSLQLRIRIALLDHLEVLEQDMQRNVDIGNHVTHMINLLR